MDVETKGDRGAGNPTLRRDFLVICWAVFFIFFFLIAVLCGGCRGLAAGTIGGNGWHCAAGRPDQGASEEWTKRARLSSARYFLPLTRRIAVAGVGEKKDGMGRCWMR